MKSTRADLNGTGYVVRLETGEDLLETLQRFVAQEGIRNAANVSAIGSASSWRFHVVASAEIPPREVLTFAVVTLVLLPDDLGIATWDRL